MIHIPQGSLCGLMPVKVRLLLTCNLSVLLVVVESSFMLHYLRAKTVFLSTVLRSRLYIQSGVTVFFATCSEWVVVLELTLNSVQRWP